MSKNNGKGLPFEEPKISKRQYKETSQMLVLVSGWARMLYLNALKETKESEQAELIQLINWWKALGFENQRIVMQKVWDLSPYVVEITAAAFKIHVKGEGDDGTNN